MEYNFSRIWTEYGGHTPSLSVFSTNAGKYELEKTLYLDTFHAVLFSKKTISFTFKSFLCF